MGVGHISDTNGSSERSENSSHITDKLLRNAVLITAEALFCLGLASLVASFLLKPETDEDTDNSPHMGMLVGGFAVIICSIAIFGVMLCLKCANTYQSKVQVDVPTANEIAKAYEEFYGTTSNTKHLPPSVFVANPTSTIIAGSSLETEETDSQDSNVNQHKFNPDRIYSVQSSNQEGGFFSVKSVLETQKMNENSGRNSGNSKSSKNVDRNGSDKRSRRSGDAPGYKKQGVSQQGSTESRKFHQKRSFSTYDGSRESR